MTGEELFVEIGKIDENMMLEAENYKRECCLRKCDGKLMPLAASILLLVSTMAKECFL